MFPDQQEPAQQLEAADNRHLAAVFERLRPRLFAIAYRMLGSATEAEDIVQDAFLRFRAADRSTIESEEGYLRAIVTRLCLDQLKSARSQREVYPGQWLPEPILSPSGGELADPADQAALADSLSFAFLLLLESLSPEERAVFLLHEVFDYDYAEIAAMVDKSEAACRQIQSRARKHIADHRARFHYSREEHVMLLDKFLAAVQTGDLPGLMDLLAEDVSTYADSGGKRPAAVRPLKGRDTVARFFVGAMRLLPPDVTFEIASVNRREGLLIRDGQGNVVDVLALETRDGHIQNIFSFRNPDKLSFWADGTDPHVPNMSS